MEVGIPAQRELRGNHHGMRQGHGLQVRDGDVHHRSAPAGEESQGVAAALADLGSGVVEPLGEDADAHIRQVLQVIVYLWYMCLIRIKCIVRCVHC